LTVPETPDLSAAIEAIWVRHRDLMFSRMSQIDDALGAAANGRLDSETRAAAHRDAHKLAGALGTFGLHDGTRCARHIEAALAGDTALDVTDLMDAARRLRAQLETR
jgi:HPt (histidine-containing phosphotransfer) domain-containing protein